MTEAIKIIYDAKGSQIQLTTTNGDKSAVSSIALASAGGHAQDIAKLREMNAEKMK